MGKFLKLFEGFGIESEFMIVDQSDLTPLNLAEEVLTTANNGVLSDEIEKGATSWSNELVTHLLEIKCNGPAKSLEDLDLEFHKAIVEINKILAPRHAMLLGSAMHPFMNPDDAILWPHGQKEIYQKYNEIFDCRGHGWSNLQSIHINLPFSNDEEFGRLHEGIRLILPVLPALCASSPIYNGKLEGLPSNRLTFYEENQKKVPSITGMVVPEAIYTLSDYHKLLQKIWADIAPYDPAGTLQHQWLNSRGAIVKFDYQVVEIRTCDIQESPYMDFCVIHFIYALLKPLVLAGTKSIISSQALKMIFDHANSWEGKIEDAQYLKIFGFEDSSMTFPDFFACMYKRVKSDIPERYHSGIEVILRQGNLATRIKARVSQGESIPSIYQQLAMSLKDNGTFLSEAVCA